MADYAIQPINDYIGACDAIRAKLGTSGKIKSGDMASLIRSIPTGGDAPTGTIEIIRNGSYNVADYAEADVNVPPTQPLLQQKSATPTAGGVLVTPDTGYDGLSVVQIPAEPNLTPENIVKDVSVFGIVGTAEDAGLIANWDFTSGAMPLIDTVRGLQATLYGSAARTANGVEITGADGRVAIPKLFPTRLRRLEVDFGAMDLNTSGETYSMRMVVANEKDGLVYRNTGYWGVYFSNWDTMTSISDPNYFANSTLAIDVAINAQWTLYRDGVQFLTSSGYALGYASGTGFPCIGASANAAYSVIVRGIRVFNTQT